MSYLSYLFPLRVPSGASALGWAYGNDSIDRSVRQEGKALISLRAYQMNERLITRSPRRKNIQKGCILPKPCFCKLTNMDAHKLDPSRFFGPAIATRVCSVEKLAPAYSETSSNTAAEAVIRKLCIDRAGS